jgi:flagellar M-ring protein FliF
MFDSIRALSSRQQVFLALGTACVLCLVLGAVWFFALRTDWTPLFTQLRPSDAATIVADLDRKKIAYRLADGGTAILVPADQADSARLDVMTGDLPLKGTVGFELFNKSDVGLTDFAQKINYQRALQGELERTIMTLDGIDSARVHLSLGEDRIFRDDRVPPKASVTIRMRKGSTLTLQAAQGVQRLIAGSVPNLDVSDVVILDESGRVIGAPTHIEALPGTGSPEAQERNAIEQYYQAIVRSAVDRAYPQLGIAVGVTALTNGTDTGALPDWNPAARSFALNVTLSTSAVLDQASQDGVRALVSGIIRSNVTISDVVQFAVTAPPQGKADAGYASAAAPRLADMPALPAEDAGRGEVWAAVALFVFFFAAAAAFFAYAFRSRAPRRLSDDERARLSAKLRAALAQGGVHAARS